MKVLLLCMTIAAGGVELGDLPLDEPFSSERPTQTPSPDVLGVGRMQAELGTTYARHGGDGEIHLRLGLAKGWELQVLASSFEDFGIAVKRRLTTASGARPALTVRLRTAPGLDLIAGWRLGTRTTLVAAAAYDHLETDEDDLDRLSGGLVTTVRHGQRWSSFLELHTREDDVEERDSVQLGVLYAFYDFQIDFRVGTGLGGEDPDYLAGFGFTLKW
jgi:hypothetical protein